MLPNYINPNEGQVDYRYFLIASGNFSLIGRDTLDQTSEYSRKVYIDDLEVPVKKRQTVSLLLQSLGRYFSQDKAEQIKIACTKYQMKKLDCSALLQEFQTILGSIKGFKYYWAYTIALPTGANDLHKQMKLVISEMQLKNETSVLIRHGKSYRSIYKYLLKRLSDYLLSIKSTLESFPEDKINTMISSMWGIEIGDLIQGKYLQHYISAKSLGILMQIFFTDKDSYDDMFEECLPRDLITVFIYWAVIKAKCNPSPGTAPCFRGYDWLKEVEDILDLSFIKVLSPEESKEKVRAKVEAKKDKKVDPNDFPTLSEEIGTHDNKKTLFEIMRSSNKSQFLVENKKAKKSQVKKADIVERTETSTRGGRGGARGGARGGKKMQGRDTAWDLDEDSEDELTKKRRIQQEKEDEAEFLKQAKDSENRKDGKKPARADKLEDNFPTLTATTPPVTLPISPQRLPLHMKAAPPSKGSNLVDNDFPTLGRGPPVNGPTLMDELKQSNKPKPKKAKKEQPQPAVIKEDKSKSIFNVSNLPKEQTGNKFKNNDDFPTLGGGGLTLLKPADKQKEPEAPKPKAAYQSTSNYAEVNTFKDPEITQPVKEKKKKNKKLAEDDFPTMDKKIDAEPQRFVSKYEAMRNQPIDIFDHFTAEEKAEYGIGIGIGAGRNQLKPPKGGKKFDELDDVPDEAVIEEKKEKQQPKPVKPVKSKAQNEDDFPTLGGGLSAPQIPKPIEFSKAVAMENSDILISKKTKKKK